MGRFVSRDPLGMWGDPAQTGNGQNYCGDNPLNWTDAYGLRSFTNEEHQIGQKLNDLAKAAEAGGDQDFASRLRAFKENLANQIRRVKEGEKDPVPVRITLDALRKWAEQDPSKAGDFGKSSAVPADFYSEIPQGKYKCNIFVAEVLYDSLGVEMDVHGRLSKYPYVANDWATGEAAKGGPTDEEHEFRFTATYAKFVTMGEVIAKHNPGGLGHVGIYLGDGLYISARSTGSGAHGIGGVQPSDGVQITDVGPMLQGGELRATTISETATGGPRYRGPGYKPPGKR